jgi:hypothetical protein
MMAAEADEELSSTFEELILLTCLYSWDARIPRKVTRDIFNSVPYSDNDITELQLLNLGHALDCVWRVIRHNSGSRRPHFWKTFPGSLKT